MKIIRAQEMGFCFGVRRALDIIRKEAARRGPLESLGGIVHNHQVVNKLEAEGVKVVGTTQEVKGKTIAVTAHGVGPQVFEEFQKLGLEVVDTTCPIVRSSQNAVKKLAEAGFYVLVFGDANHPEVKGVLGWANGHGRAVQSWNDVKDEPLPMRIGILAQTTQNPQRFTRFVNEVMEDYLHQAREIRVINTLCDATSLQQEAAMVLAQQVDIVLVIGGKHSANTRHLAEVSAEQGVETHHIESAEEVDPAWLVGKELVGITAGASTPDDLVEEVVARLEEISLLRRASRPGAEVS